MRIKACRKKHKKHSIVKALSKLFSATFFFCELLLNNSLLELIYFLNIYTIAKETRKLVTFKLFEC